MPNQIYFKKASPAARFYEQCDLGDRAQVDAALDDIRNHPEPDGVKRTSVQMPPVTVCFYNDGQTRVTYNVSWTLDHSCCNINVLAIAIQS